MASELIVKLKVPIAVSSIVPTAALIFSKWLPLKPDDALQRSIDGLTAYVWFDITTTWWADQMKEEDLPRQINVCTHFVNVDVVIKSVADDLAAYIRARDYRELPAPANKALQDRFDDLGRSVVRLTLETYNRMVGFVRSSKGQYWLNEYEIDLDRTRSYLTHFEAKVVFPDGEKSRFLPCIDHMNVRMIAKERYIDRADWRNVQAFVAANSKTPLVGTLLAGSEELAGSGQSRVAITESITALEVALSQFAERPVVEKVQGEETRQRMGLDAIKHQVEHMGLTGSVSYLLPLLFPAAILPANVLAGARDAIQARQNIVHRGARGVARDKLETMMRSVTQLCRILEAHTDVDWRPPAPKGRTEPVTAK